jgi:hypothetical protein
MKINLIVNDGQKPITEYLSLKKYSFFILKNKRIFQLIRIINLFLLIFLFLFFQKKNEDVFTFIDKIPHFFYLKELFLIQLFLFVLLITALARYKALCFSLNESFISYEEGSWYNSQMYQKSAFLIKVDKLLNKQKIRKIQEEILKTSLFLSSIFFFFL